jgi:hypothetical protein
METSVLEKKSETRYELASNNQTSLNPAQILFLQAIRYIKTDEDALELKEIISNYYLDKLQKEADRLWDNGQLGDFLLDEHLRTPYK